MNIVFLNTFSSGGGAAIAANRLKSALEENFSDIVITQLSASNRSILDKVRVYLPLALEKGLLKLLLKDKNNLFRFSWALFGQKISNKRVIQEADLIHIHWINNAFITLKEIEKLKKLGKPLVITLHDMWFFTGGCHYSGSCMGFMSDCRACPFLKLQSPAMAQLKAKIDIFNISKTHFIGCSQWISDLAGKSQVANGGDVVAIPNPIEMREVDSRTNLKIKYKFTPQETVLIFTSAKLDDKRKGLHHLLMALNKRPEKDLTLVLVGDGFEKIEIPEHIKTVNFGFIKDEKKKFELIAMADLMVCPSEEDNLPNTVMEALSMGTPVLAFDIGGLSDMVDHGGNGYLAKLKEADNGMTDGLDWFLKNRNELDAGKIREKCFEKFSFEAVSASYMNVYRRALT